MVNTILDLRFCGKLSQFVDETLRWAALPTCSSCRQIFQQGL
ncbi:hypothetical protein FDUTEX481_01002 [Tolypothrix sp. PCC 7601]|nr:hypothetical protein FDUTEX481_01002 [Tolypothrix sp. PCC 7601]